jgi:hypothetical protein
MMGSQPASAATAWGRSRPWVSEIAPMVRIMSDQTTRGAKCAGRLLSWVQPQPWIISLAGCVLQSLRLFGACHKKQCRVDWLSNRILKSSDDTAATPETASIGSGKIMSLARPDWVAERQGGEAHRPVLANCKAGSAPND